MKRITKLLALYAACACFALASTLTASAEGGDAGDGGDVTGAPGNVATAPAMPDTATETGAPGPGAQGRAELFPADVTEDREGGGWRITRTYELRPGESPGDIPRESFQRGGWTFTLAEIVRRDAVDAETRVHSETVEFETETRELEEILRLLAPTVAYSGDGFAGDLALDMSSIAVEAAGTSTYS